MAGYETYDRQQVYKQAYDRFMNMAVPPCTKCGSTQTASVQVGVVWVTIQLAATCPKVKLIPNGPKPGNWFCKSCSYFFDVPAEPEKGVPA
jgi:hypothetical protein